MAVNSVERECHRCGGTGYKIDISLPKVDPIREYATPRTKAEFNCRITSKGDVLSNKICNVCNGEGTIVGFL